ncbi:reverse transcriptase zinc-binding domain-containing protein [Tanacetum coccineum]
MLVEMADVTKKAPLGIIENILVRIDKFLFPSDFVIIEKNPNETIILGRPFLATIHEEINVFDKEISLEIDNDRVSYDMEKKDQNFTTPTEKFFMIKYELDNRPQSPACSNNQSRNLRDRSPDDSLHDQGSKKKKINASPAPGTSSQESNNPIPIDYTFKEWTLIKDFKDYTGCEPKTYISDLLKYLDILEKFIDKSVLKYGELRMQKNEVNAINKSGKQLNAAILHEHEIEKRFKLHLKDVQINLVQAVDANLVVTKSSGTKLDKQDTSNISRNYTTHVVDADIRPVNDQEPLVEVQLTAQHNVLANEQQHTEQSEPIFDTYLLEKVDCNTTHDSTNMSNRGGEIDQNTKKCQFTSPLLDPLTQPIISEQSYQSLESENISLKKTVAQFQKDFSRMEAHCVNLELKYQNQALKFGQHG